MLSKKLRQKLSDSLCLHESTSELHLGDDHTHGKIPSPLPHTRLYPVHGSSKAKSRRPLAPQPFAALPYATHLRTPRCSSISVAAAPSTGRRPVATPAFDPPWLQHLGALPATLVVDARCTGFCETTTTGHRHRMVLAKIIVSRRKSRQRLQQIVVVALTGCS